MPVRGTAVAVRLAHLDADQVQLSVAYAAFGDDGIGKITHPLHRTLEHDALDALLVVEMGVHRRDGEVVVRVLDARQALGELAFVMIVYVGQVRDAGAPGVALLAVALQVGAQHVPHRLAACRVAAMPDQLVEGGRQTLVERYGETIHAGSGFPGPGR
jgi:hypothetical protein